MIAKHWGYPVSATPMLQNASRQCLTKCHNFVVHHCVPAYSKCTVYIPPLYAHTLSLRNTNALECVTPMPDKAAYFIVLECFAACQLTASVQYNPPLHMHTLSPRNKNALERVTPVPDKAANKIRLYEFTTECQLTESVHSTPSRTFPVSVTLMLQNASRQCLTTSQLSYSSSIPVLRGYHGILHTTLKTTACFRIFSSLYSWQTQIVRHFNGGSENCKTNFRAHV